MMTASTSDTSEAGEPTEGSAADGERMAEAAVIALLLTEQPAQLTAEEVIRALSNDRLSGLTIEDAADRLERAGLVHREGRFIIPSRAALRMDRLPIETARQALPRSP